ncbi:hypothetical protein EJB05_47963, partial [Eragrostis curvula]
MTLLAAVPLGPTATGAARRASEARRAAKQEESKEDLVSLINNEGEDLRVIAVWGTSGDLGLTTIVNAAYENPDVKKKFSCRAWIRILHPFNPNDFIQSLVKQFRSAEGVDVLLEPEKTGQDLAKEFTGYVNEKSYLIVLNDLSSFEEWNVIKTCFPPSSKKGSRIVVCSSQVEVASLCTGQENQIVELKQLSTDQTIYAFFKKDPHVLVKPHPMSSSNETTTSTNSPMVLTNEGLANQSEGSDERKVITNSFTRTKTLATALEESQLVGREKEKCDMVRLIISNQPSQESIVISVWGMGGLGKTTLVKDVYQSQALMNMFEKRAFVTVLRPFILKELLKSLIMQLTVESSERKEPTDLDHRTRSKVAAMEIDSLIVELSRLIKGKTCLIVLDDLSSTTEWDHIKRVFDKLDGTCQILVTTREESIAKHCSGKQENICQLKVLEDKDALNLFTKKEDKMEFQSVVDLARIRSLTVFGEWRSFYISEKMRLLRVLDLESTSGLVDHHLEHIGSLVHLKYISLRGCGGIYHLPDSWGNLLQLETLDIKGTRICRLPKSITKLRKLQHLFGGDLDPYCVWTNEIIPHDLMNLWLACCALKFLKDAEAMNGDPNRHDLCTYWWHVIFPTLAGRRLDPSGFVLPKGIRKLKSLHTLGLVNIGGGNKSILQDIRRLTQLRKLAVRGINKRNHQEFCSALADLRCLESLSVGTLGSPPLYVGIEDLCGLLDGVSSPPSNLQSLKLSAKLVKLPEWIGKLQNLVKLKLYGTKLSDVDGSMQVLGKLPNLAILRLLEDPFYITEESNRLNFRPEAPFPSLMVLELFYVEYYISSGHLVSVEFGQGAAPNLELLRFCGNSRGPADLFSGLASLPKLKEFGQNYYPYEFEADVQAQLALNPNGPILKKYSRTEMVL